MITTKHLQYLISSDKVEVWLLTQDPTIDPPFIRQPFTNWNDISEWFIAHLEFLDKSIDENLNTNNNA